MNGARTLLSIWLVPAEPERSSLAQRITELARHYDAPCFAPHITLYAGSTARAPFRERLARALHGVPALSVQTIEVGHSDELFKSVFLKVTSSAALIALQRRVVAALQDADDYAFDPHLSLIYKVLPESTRVELAHQLDARSTFLCDALSVVTPGAAGWVDVSGWQVLSTESLAPPCDR